jgi:hypothetical protein
VRPEDVRLHGNERRRQRTRRRLSLPLLVAAGLLVPLGLAWAIGSSPEPDDGQRYQAVLVRGLDRHDDGSATDDLEVVLADADGSVQPLRRMPASRFPAQGGIWNPALSTQGWLTFSTQVGDGPEPTDVLLDLADPDRAPTLLPGWSRTGWAPDGSLWRESTGTELIDPESGTRTSVEREDGGDLQTLPLGSWSLATTIDGELVVSAPPDPVDGEPTLPRMQAWGGIDAGGRLTLAIPRIAENGRLRYLSPRWGVLWVCDSDPSALAYCPGRPRGSVISGPAADGTYRTWRGRPARDEFVVQASWAADGGAWLLLDRRSIGRTLALVHLALDGTEREVASFVADPEGGASIDALAPDDSMVAIGWLDEAGWWTALVDIRSGRTTLHRGSLAGFARPDDARPWIHDDGASEQGTRLAGSAAPNVAATGYPPLPTVETQTEGMERTLLIHEEPGYPAASGGNRPSVVLGPVDLDDGYGISLVCSGPGDVSYTVNDEDPELKHCQDSFSDEWASLIAEDDITVTVVADASTAWRMVVFDPPPWVPRGSPGTGDG